MHKFAVHLDLSGPKFPRWKPPSLEDTLQMCWNWQEPFRCLFTVHGGTHEKAQDLLECPEPVGLRQRDPGKKKQLPNPPVLVTKISTMGRPGGLVLCVSLPGRGPMFIYLGKPWLAKGMSSAGQEAGHSWDDKPHSSNTACDPAYLRPSALATFTKNYQTSFCVLETRPLCLSTNRKSC